MWGYDIRLVYNRIRVYENPLTEHNRFGQQIMVLNERS